MPFPTFLWKKIDPDAIWLGPALIIMQILLFNHMCRLMSLDTQLIVTFLAIFLIFLGLVMMLISPLRKGVERGNVSEALIVQSKKSATAMIAFSFLLATVNVIFFLSI